MQRCLIQMICARFLDRKGTKLHTEILKYDRLSKTYCSHEAEAGTYSQVMRLIAEEYVSEMLI